GTGPGDPARRGQPYFPPRFPRRPRLAGETRRTGCERRVQSPDDGALGAGIRAARLRRKYGETRGTIPHAAARLFLNGQGVSTNEMVTFGVGRRRTGGASGLLELGQA